MDSPGGGGGGVCVLSHVQLFATPWTVAHQVPLWNFPGNNTGMGCHYLLQGIFLIQGSKLCLPVSHISRQILYHWATWEVAWGLQPLL